MSADDILLEAEEHMDKSADVLREELRRLRTGRASTGLVESIRVEYYGTPTPLKQMAHIGVQEGQVLVIRPYDPSVLKDIEKAILASDLGITPQNDGKMIRLSVPSLSTERRRQLAHRVNELAEEARIAIRNVRRDANKHIDRLEKDKELGEDERDTAKDEVQELTRQHEDQVNTLAEEKSQEIMEE